MDAFKALSWGEGWGKSLESNELSIYLKDLVKAYLNNPKVGWEK